MTYDLVVKDARIVDGTGKPAYSGDVAIQDGRIAAVGEVSGAATRTIDADGQVVAPGFIDAHTHYDAQLLWDPTANPSTAHGITTILTGNCGYTLAPVRSDDQDYLMGLFAAAEEIPKQALQRFAPFGWETFPEYLGWLPGRLGVNVLTQVGHSAVRRFVMGEAALERAATEDEIAQMVGICEAAMDAGAAGISSSQAPHQRGELGEHIPSFFADGAETRALAEAVRRKGKRLLSINPATKRDGLSDEDRALLVELAEVSGRRRLVERLRHGNAERRQRARIHGSGAPTRAQDLRGRAVPATRDALHAEEALGDLRQLGAVGRALAPGPARQARRARRSGVARPPRRVLGDGALHGEHVGREGGQPATAAARGPAARRHREERGVSPADVMFDVARDDKLETFFRISGPVDVDESRLERILQSPATLVGISDGGAHLQTFAGGDYTSYFLAHWVREKGAFTLEEGVAALTSRVAHFLGITDRGTLETGKAADLVIFDPDTVEPLALQTLDDIPGGGTRMTKAARGIPWVLVNGNPVVEDGVATTAVPGAVLGTD